MSEEAAKRIANIILSTQCDLVKDGPIKLGHAVLSAIREGLVPGVEYRATPAPAPADEPFMYAIADIEGRAVLDEVCVAEHPSELELSEEDEGRGWKIVPVYTGPQIEAMREALNKQAPAPVTVSEAAVQRARLVAAVSRRLALLL